MRSITLQRRAGTSTPSAARAADQRACRDTQSTHDMTEGLPHPRDLARVPQGGMYP